MKIHLRDGLMIMFHGGLDAWIKRIADDAIDQYQKGLTKHSLNLDPSIGWPPVVPVPGNYDATIIRAEAHAPNIINEATAIKLTIRLEIPGPIDPIEIISPCYLKTYEIARDVVHFYKLGIIYPPTSESLAALAGKKCTIRVQYTERSGIPNAHTITFLGLTPTPTLKEEKSE